MQTTQHLILLDLGGVLVRVEAAPRVAQWTQGRIPAAQFWKRWLSSPAVARFESGKSDPVTFSREAVEDLGLEIAPERFLADFRTWLSGTYPEAREVVREIRTCHPVASFSNSNVLHWEDMRRLLDVDTLFDASTPSHLLGVCKPKPEAFRSCAQALDRDPRSIVFFDDNEVNVQGARAAGMTAFRVQGPQELRQAWRMWKENVTARNPSPTAP